MRKLSVPAGLLLTLACIVAIHGCTKEPGDTEPGNIPKFSVADARAFFETASAENAVTRSDEENPYRIFGFHTGDYEPFWQYAEHSMNEWIESVDVPIFGEFYYTGWFASDWTTATDTTRCYFAPVLQKLVVVRHRDDEEATGYYIMSIIPSEDYIHEYGDPDHDSFLNGSVPDTFSGMVIYTEPETAFIVRADRYHEGIKVVWASIFDESKELVDNMRDIRHVIGYIKMGRYHIVTTRIGAKVDEQCGWGGVIEAVTCNGNGPKPPPVVTDPSVKPPISGGPDPSPPSGGSSSGGGGNGGSGGIDRGGNDGIRSLYDSIFDVSDLTDEEKNELNEHLSEILADYAGNNLVNALGSMLNITFDATRRDAIFVPSSGTSSITLNKWDHSYLFHEMFHAYQFSRTNSADWGGRQLNNEVEAHAAEYLYLRRKGLLETNGAYYSIYRNSIGGQAASMIISMLDNSGNRLSIYSASEIQQGYLDSADLLKNQGGYSQYPFNNTLSGLDALNLLQSIFNDS
ncbi:MAG: hypothetical protein LIO85_00470 [Rikenellaceae bacterium]|nr:hypothetical protein [Rikenellaceae bacterium]